MKSKGYTLYGSYYHLSPTPLIALIVTVSIKNSNLVSAKHRKSLGELAKAGNSFDIAFSKMNEKKYVVLKLNGLAVGEKVTINGKDDKKVALPDNISLNVKSNQKTK